MTAFEKKLTRSLLKRPGIKLAILFGSRAKGQAGNASDIDLALLSEAPLTGAEKLDIMESVGAEFGCPVDVVDLYGAGEPILGQVLQGKRLLGDSAVHARLLTKHLLDTADFVPLQQRILEQRRDAWISE